MEKNEHYRLLYSALQSLITHDYILLDLPYYSNVGDVLIWEATLQLLKKIHHRCLYSCSVETYRKPHINKDVILLFSGGGNFGDLWEKHQSFRHHVMVDFPENPVVQLPQSVWFEHRENLDNDIIHYANHKAPITICLREQQSYDIIKNNYTNVTTLLLPDMVLAMDINKILKRNRITTIAGVGSLYFKRDDKELAEIKTNIVFDAEGDWPCRIYTLTWIRRYDKLIKRLERLQIPEWIRLKITHWYYRFIIKDAYLRNGIRFLMPFRNIYATRLHAAILGILLGKNVYMIDNSYHKCSEVYFTWMRNISNVTLL